MMPTTLFPLPPAHFARVLAALRANMLRLLIVCMASLSMLAVPAANAAHTMTKERFLGDDGYLKAKNACAKFATAVFYDPAQYCGHGGDSNQGIYGWGGGWFRTDGPSGVSQDFVYGTFLYCPVGERYIEVEDRCRLVQEIPDAPPPSESGPPCAPSCTSQPQPHPGEPINPATGNMWHRETDYTAADPSALAMTRTYNSTRLKLQNAPSQGFGENWSHPYFAALSQVVPFSASQRSRKCFKRPDNGMTWCEVDVIVKSAIPPGIAITRGDGKQIEFNRGEGNVWYPRANNNGRVTAVLSADGLSIAEWVYEDRWLRTIERFDASGRLKSISSKNGRVQTLTYSSGTSNDTSGSRLPAEAPACNNIHPGLPLSAGHLLCVTDNFGRQLNFEYDDHDRIVKTIDPEGKQYLYAYNGPSAGCIDATANSSVACSANNLTSVTFPDGKSKTYHYGEKAQINSGRTCSYAGPAGTVYPHLKNVMTGLTDENGKRYISWTYDCDGLATSSEKANGVEKVSLTYYLAPAPAISSVYVAYYVGKIPNSTFTQAQYQYQDVGHFVKKNIGVSSACANCGSYKARTYDANGNDASRTDWAGNVTNFVYDLASNLETSRTEAVGTPQQRKISTEWDLALRLPSKIAEPKRITTFAYDGAGNTLQRSIQATTDLTGAAGFGAAASGPARTWKYTYNEIGQMLTATGPRTDVASVTTYTYNGSSGELATITNPLMHTTRLSDYDAHGRARRIDAANGVITRMTYTDRGLLATRSVSAGAVTQTTNYNYDDAGLLTSVTEPGTATVTMGYDDAHRLTSISDSLGNTITYELDLTGNRVGEKTKDQNGVLVRAVSRIYDTMNHLQQVTGAAQ